MTKQEKIEQYLQEPLKVDNYILIKGYGSRNKEMWGIVKVTNIIDGQPYIKDGEKISEEWKKWTGEIGVDPFDKSFDRISSINFELESILFQLFKEDKYDIKGTPIKASNDNPYVFVDGEKKYYQKPK